VVRIDNMSIYCKNLSVYYDNRCYLDNCDIELSEKKITLLYGPSGSGKTTIFNILSGLVKAQSNKSEIYWNNYKVRNIYEANKIRYKYISMIYSNFYFLNNLSVVENIILPAVFTKQPKNIIENKLSLLYDVFSFDKGSEIDNFLNLKSLAKRKKIIGLSNGQKEMVSIARALMIDSPFIFADEMLRSCPIGDEMAIWERLLSKEIGIGKRKGLFFISHKEHLKKDHRIDRLLTIKNKKLFEV